MKYKFKQDDVVEFETENYSGFGTIVGYHSVYNKEHLYIVDTWDGCDIPDEYYPFHAILVSEDNLKISSFANYMAKGD